jgi:hypothetical protein
MFPAFRLNVTDFPTMRVKTREDGYRFITCDDLPGFSYILEPGEYPNVMIPTLEAFVIVNSEWLRDDNP